MPERNTMKKIQELQQVKGDAYDYYIAGNEDTDLFEKIFLVDDIVEEICKPDKYFLIGEKGSGKQHIRCICRNLIRQIVFVPFHLWKIRCIRDFLI